MKTERLNLNRTQIRHSAAIISKNRIRAPREHGEALVMPPLNSTSQIWDDNRKLLKTHEFQINGINASEFRVRARRHLVATASAYSSQYRDVPETDLDRIILSGHQPRLFHPGVWFKNFALSSLGQKFQATAVNLIVDNDLCGLSRESIPRIVNENEATTTSIPYDAAGGNLPFENRTIVDRTVFDSFASRLAQAISPTVPQPIVHSLWRHTRTYTDPAQRLGHSLAAARHKLEEQYDLQTLEIPLSQVCQSIEFASFTAEILSQISDFQSAYNESLHEYREVHRIRSHSHPVPELEVTHEGFETPFWIWSREKPVRRGLYVSINGNRLTLTNRDEISIRLSEKGLSQQLFDLAAQGIAIRPRALMTTMYSRLILSDLFLHGIGGSKYDQLTDAIITRFWKCLPPVFMTLTATMKLPFEFEKVTPQDIAKDDQLLRELRFHPEKHITSNSSSVQATINAKRAWIKRDLPRGMRKDRHDAITNCNEQLQSLTHDVAESVVSRQQSNRLRLARTRILDARGYTFSCFGEEIVDELKSLADFSTS